MFGLIPELFLTIWLDLALVYACKTFLAQSYLWYSMVHYSSTTYSCWIKTNGYPSNQILKHPTYLQEKRQLLDSDSIVNDDRSSFVGTDDHATVIHNHGWTRIKTSVKKFENTKRGFCCFVLTNKYQEKLKDLRIWNNKKN